MPEMLYEEVLEVDERVVLYRGEPGAGTPVKGTAECWGQGQQALTAFDPDPAASSQAAQGTCWKCSSLWIWGACEGSWKVSCPGASAAWPWCSCTRTREWAVVGRGQRAGPEC